MTTQRKLRTGIATLIGTAGLLLAVALPANADVGEAGIPILYAGSGQEAHVCNVIGGANTEYSAVVCADILTSQSGSVYYAKAQVEAYCQVTKTAAPVACEAIQETTDLTTGNDNSTGWYSNSCSGNCPTGRLYKMTRTWDYSVANAGGGECASNEYLTYDVDGVAIGPETDITTPTGQEYVLSNGNGNDNLDEATNFHYVCPN
ncbi:MAG TPA: hypothetical protein VMU95_40525 [Trebonia sp.]|nr:hypothetical protein [Trebonia sp.]